MFHISKKKKNSHDVRNKNVITRQNILCFLSKIQRCNMPSSSEESLGSQDSVLEIVHNVMHCIHIVRRKQRRTQERLDALSKLYKHLKKDIARLETMLFFYELENNYFCTQ